MNAPEVCILAVDPGLSGAYSFLFPSQINLISVYDIPLAGAEIDAAAFARSVQQMAPTLAIIEQVAARPGQGVSSMFRFGQSYGTVRGVVAALGIPCHLVTPGRWKKHFRLSADKEEARALAVRLWPQSGHFERKRDHGRAEAALIALCSRDDRGGGRSVMTGLAPIAQKLSKLLPLLGSDKDGEVVATARAIGRTLRSAGLDFHTLAAAVETGRPAKSSKGRRRAAQRQSAGPVDAELYREAVWCQEQRDRCNAKEVDFLASMVMLLSRGRQPSEKQVQWLADIGHRLRSGGAS